MSFQRRYMRPMDMNSRATRQAVAGEITQSSEILVSGRLATATFRDGRCFPPYRRVGLAHSPNWKLGGRLFIVVKFGPTSRLFVSTEVDECV